MINLVDSRQASFSLPAADGKIITEQSYAGQWLLMVFHRHLG